MVMLAPPARNKYAKKPGYVGGARATPEPGSLPSIGTAYNPAAASADRFRRITEDPTPNQALIDLLGEGFRLRDEGERRRTETLGFQRGAVDAANKPTMTDDDWRTFGAKQAGDVTRKSQGAMRDWRSFLGSSGITGGGYAASGLASIELDRMGQTLKNRADLKLEKARTDALDRANHFLRSQVVAGLMNESPNAAGFDSLGSALDTRLGIWQTNTAADVARQQGRDAKKGGEMAMFGGLASGLLGLL